MEWLQYFFSGIIDSIQFYLPAIAYNLGIYLYFIFVLQRELIPLDGGVAFNGNRLLGDGRTAESIFIALLVGGVIGGLQGDSLKGVYLAVGASFGCVVGSFLKRRLGADRGEPKFPIDNIDFICGASLGYMSAYPMNWKHFLFGLLAIGLAHILINLYLRPLVERSVERVSKQG